jgi:hypothetical protein
MVAPLAGSGLRLACGGSSPPAPMNAQLRNYVPLDDGHEPTDFDEYYDVPAKTDEQPRAARSIRWAGSIGAACSSPVKQSVGDAVPGLRTPMQPRTLPRAGTGWFHRALATSSGSYPSPSSRVDVTRATVALILGWGQRLRDLMTHYLLCSLHCRPSGVPIRCRY